MQESEKILLDVLGDALFDAPFDIPEDTNFGKLFEEAEMQAVLPIVYDAVCRNATLPNSIKNLGRNRTATHLYHNEAVNYEQKNVIGLLEDANIPCVILKGSASAMNYPRPELRVMGDIDLLVKPELQTDAVKLLQENGYGEIDCEGHPNHLAIKKDNISVEIHKQPGGISMAEDKEMAEKLRQFFIDAIDKRHIENDLPIMSDKHMALLLILHKVSHFLNGNLGLRQLCDWAVFVHNRMTDELWNELKPNLVEFGLLYFTNIMTTVCVEYLHLEHKSWLVECDKTLVHDTMGRIVTSGNFGIKEHAYGQRYFTNINSSNRIASFLRVTHLACGYHWPICKKHPILMPVAPFVIYGKYLKLRKEGKREALHPIKLYKTSGSKQKLYKELKPFVTDNNSKLIDNCK